MVDWNELQQLRFRREQLLGGMHRTQQEMASWNTPDIDFDMHKLTLDAERELLEAYDMRIKRMERLSRLEAEGEQAQDA